MSRQTAHLLLLLAAAFWGFGNISQKIVLDHVGPFTAVCLRCAIAAAVILPLAAMESRARKQSGFWASLVIVAASFAAAICFQQYAYLQATVTNASFLVNTCTVLTPLIAWLFLRERPGAVPMVAAVVTLAGVLLMSAGPGWLVLNGGDLACLVSAVFYAIWMVALGRHAQRYGLPFTTALVQFLAAAVTTLPSLAMEAPRLDAIIAAGPTLAVLGIFTTAAAFGLQTYAQKYTTASRAAVIVSAESIFGAMGAFVALNERPALLVVIGALVIFSAIILVSMASGDVREKTV